MHTRSASLRSVREDPEDPVHFPHTADTTSHNDPVTLTGLSETLFENSSEEFPQQPGRIRTAVSGNLLITAVHHTGVLNLEVLYCICQNASDRDEQLLDCQLFASSVKNIETVFTFSVLDDFLMDRYSLYVVGPCFISLIINAFTEISLSEPSSWMAISQQSICITRLE
jgi:hypothetical protein